MEKQIATTVLSGQMNVQLALSNIKKELAWVNALMILTNS